MRLARLQAGRGDFADMVEICRHRSAAEQFEELAGFALAAVAAIETRLGESSVATFLAEVVPMIATSADGFLMLADRESQALLRTGSVTAATNRATAILETTRQRAQGDPSDAGAQRDLSVSYNSLGDLMLQLGDGAQVERLYRDSLAIRERLAQGDPSNAGAQRDLSVSYNSLGDLMLQLGDGAQAERLYRDSLAIRERLAQGDPSDAGAQRDLSVSYEKLGDLMLQLGDGAQAERLYRDSLAIAEPLLESDHPWTQSIRDKLLSPSEGGTPST